MGNKVTLTAKFYQGLNPNTVIGNDIKYYANSVGKILSYNSDTGEITIEADADIVNQMQQKPIGISSKSFENKIDSIRKLIDELPEEERKTLLSYYQNDTLYSFLYNDCIHESASMTMSVHRTRKGAEMALDFHKNESHKQWKEMFPTEDEQEEYPFGKHESWFIKEIKIQE
jgi:hypothetical protein